MLGRNGAGKSSLLQLLSGMQEPLEGQIKIDDTALALIDPLDIRRDLGLLNQNSHLFFGSIRENLKLGAPLATDSDILNALKNFGCSRFCTGEESWTRLSNSRGRFWAIRGQKQALLLARQLIRKPNILLLYEPTAAFDDVSEKQFIEHLRKWLDHRTLIVATHRRPILELVDRVIVINNGKIIMDGPKEKVLNLAKMKQQGGE
ncbi:ATP-binding cassette domain-containing protein [Acinetobacter baumannii]